MKIDLKSQTSGAFWLLGDSQTGASRGGGADRGWKVQSDRIVHYFQPYEGDQNFNQGFGKWTKNSVLSFIAKSDNVTYQMFNNAAQLGSDSTKSSSRYSPIKRIMQASDSHTTNDFQGTLSELIFYTSDQTANRFKIESNINNYYGLYNDANEFSTSTWQNGGTGSNDSWDSLTNSSTDGFVASTSNGFGSLENAVCSLNFANVVPNNGRVFVSFNLEFGGTAVSLDSKKVRVQLRNSSGSIANDIVQPADGGDGGTQFRICNQGVNTVAFTVNSNTASNLEFLLEVGNFRTGNITVTDLKVSRIARNGFVETWYDQSGNGRDMGQDTADHQPRIVRNGGQVIDPSSRRPSINFGLQPDGTGGRLLKLTSNIPQTTDNSFTQLVVASIDRTDIANARFTGGAIDLFINADEKLSTRFGDNKTASGSSGLTALGVNSTTLLGAVITTSKVPTLHFNNTEQTLSAHSGTGTPTMFQILGENNITGDSLNRYHLSGTMSEAICYLSDQTNNIPALKANINNQYQLYS